MKSLLWVVLTQIITKTGLPSPTHGYTGHHLPGASDNLAKTGSGYVMMVMEGGIWFSASENTISSVSTKPFMELRGPDVATSITTGPYAAGARPRIPCEKKSILGVLLQLDTAVLHRGFNTPHIIGHIWGYFGTSNVAFVDVYRTHNLCNIPEKEAVKYDDLIGRNRI